ncbi:receptor like protein 21-like [Neltuma alba]|uniref:receptor like protein 21-like n=1 Tax=Neltuma alba TaxID=207710 RepID=UPI0010A30EAB|nr:receptor like protein 21-like [Prosopis alba]
MGYHSVRSEDVLCVMAIIMFIFLGFSGESEGCLKEEREALLKLKEAFNYPSGSSLPSWNNHTFSADCCTWEAVECDNSTRRVISLSLNDTRAYELRRIKWSLNASSFLPFIQLQVLRLDGNYLSGLLGDIRLANLETLDLQDNMLREFPYFDLSHSRNLEGLWLGANYLEGSIPESITSLTSLTTLTLDHNNLTGSLPQQGGLCNMKNLALLDLVQNEFEGQLPACLSNLTSLRTLILEGNRFEGTFPSSLFHSFRSLVALTLSDGNFTGSFSLSSLSNNSNLKIFSISCSNANLNLETENPPFIPSFQLRSFIIDNCTLNEANTNKMPTFLLHQYDLLHLELTSTNISGTFPSWLLTNNTSLNVFSLTHNLFTGPFELNSTSKLLQMESFDISSNPIRDEIPSHIGFIFPNLISLNMSSISLQGPFPASIGEMRQLNDLDLSNNNLYGYLPQEFGHGINELRFLKLSNNNLSGPCLPIRSNFTYLLFLDLSNNNYKGKLEGGVMNSTELRMLDISANQLYGEMPSWIGKFQHLSYLKLSENNLIGPLPKNFCNLTELTYLDLAYNKFNGSLPSCLNMPLLKYLHLQSNHFMGPLPSTLANSPLLLILDLMNNNFSGPLSRVNGSFLSLRVLMLKGNKLEGSIPTHLCELKNIRLLDLSQNKLSGGIPYCLNNITFGKIDAARETEIGIFTVSWTTTILDDRFNPLTGEIDIPEQKENVTLHKDQEVDFTTKSRYESYKRSNLNLMSGLDLSSNQLVGEIPSQIGYLDAIHALNLSNNQLKGLIPETFSNLKQIESLDLSHNKLTGHIPAQLTQLYSLSSFSVAQNNLSGTTPDMKNQFATFDSASYEGNPFLCGPPLRQNCSIAGRNRQPHHLKAYDFQDAFLWSFAGAFGVFFIGVITVLYLNPYICNYKLLILERVITNYLYEWWRKGKRS